MASAPTVEAFFSASASGDVATLREFLARQPDLVHERHDGTTALHVAVHHPDAVRLLLQHGADPHAKGRTPLAVAMLRGDVEAMRRLHAAGATQPTASDNPVPGILSTLGPSMTRLTPMLAVPDMQATIDWYQSIGFGLAGTYGENGRLNWACVRFGAVDIMFVPSSKPWQQQTEGVSVWIRTERIDDVYAHLKRQQLQRARAMLAGEATSGPEVRFTLDLHTAFYGQREFGVIDPNGVHVMFAQPVDRAE